ncbi:MAG: hypothetical protein J6K30_01490 [Oscillospiraceae bacterium]|nr:hypothetical protein [Oscillospiraceae bacterium]
MTLTEKLAYIKGLAEGLGVDETTKEGKVLLALVDLMDDVTTAVSELESDMDQAYEELDAIDEDLTDIEDFLWEDEDEDDCDCCDCDCDDDDECDCCDCEDDDELFDGGIYEITCPKCGEIVCMDEDMLFSPDCGCPNCGTSFEIDFDGVECCDDEDCCCHDHDHEEE